MVKAIVVVHHAPSIHNGVLVLTGVVYHLHTIAKVMDILEPTIMERYVPVALVNLDIYVDLILRSFIWMKNLKALDYIVSVAYSYGALKMVKLQMLECI